ncbi:MAG: hypothetical protein V4631_18795 [Pseudomonadota bacterium]
MTDSVYAPPQAHLTMPGLVSKPAFYVVSLRKFSMLFLATLGLYGLYWFYQNWSRCKQSARADNGPDGNIWPVPRTIFTILFIHSLFYSVDEYAKKNQRPLDWNVDAVATPLVIMFIVSGILSRVAGNGVLFPYTLILTLLTLVPIMFSFRKAQESINQSCGDPAGDSNNTLTAANYCWLIGGGMFSLLTVIGLFLPEAQV